VRRKNYRGVEPGEDQVWGLETPLFQLKPGVFGKYFEKMLKNSKNGLNFDGNV